VIPTGQRTFSFLTVRSSVNGLRQNQWIKAFLGSGLADCPLSNSEEAVGGRRFRMADHSSERSPISVRERGKSGGSSKPDLPRNHDL